MTGSLWLFGIEAVVLLALGIFLAWLIGCYVRKRFDFAASTSHKTPRSSEIADLRLQAERTRLKAEQIRLEAERTSYSSIQHRVDVLTHRKERGDSDNSRRVADPEHDIPDSGDS